MTTILNRRQVLLGLVAAPAVIRLAPLMRIVPRHVVDIWAYTRGDFAQENMIRLEAEIVRTVFLTSALLERELGDRRMPIWRIVSLPKPPPGYGLTYTTGAGMAPHGGHLVDPSTAEWFERERPADFAPQPPAGAPATGD